MESRSPHGKGQFLGKMASTAKYIGRFAVCCAKTAEQIDLSFGLWIRVDPSKHKFNRIPRVAPMWPTGPRNHQLDGVQFSLLERAILRERDAYFKV